MTAYRLRERLSADVVALDSRHGSQVFTACRLRKKTRCCVCYAVLKPGAEAFRPVTNGNNRMDRICGQCVRTT